jgi:hypothetical protein
MIEVLASSHLSLLVFISRSVLKPPFFIRKGLYKGGYSGSWEIGIVNLFNSSLQRIVFYKHSFVNLLSEMATVFYFQLSLIM